MRGRRSGIANLVGTVFFILIVALMVGAIVTMFDTFNSTVASQHSSDQSALSVQQQALGVQNLVFGGLTSYDGFSYAAKGAVTLSANSEQNPILPITNMNFTGNMNGWTTSRSYTKVTDSATVQITPQLLTYNSTYPTLLKPYPPFFLTVYNTNLAGSNYHIAKVTLLVDQNWGVPTPQPVTNSWGATPLVTSPPSVVGNNITWVANLPSDIFGGGNPAISCLLVPVGCQTFEWTPTIPQVYGTFYDTVVVSWTTSLAPPAAYTDTAIATVNSTVTRTEVSDSGTIGTSVANINPAPAGAAPSGVSPGYDGNALLTSSESGPGSMYVDYEPSFNSVPIADGQQLTSTVDFTTAFYLDTATTQNLAPAKCCTLTWANSLDGINAPRNSLVLYQAYLTQSTLFSGTTTVGTLATTLHDTSPTWTPGWWVGDYLQYTSGPAIGQTLKITANTANTISTGAFSPSPTAGGGDTFIISGQTYELPVGGTSAGATACGITPNSVDYLNPTTYNDFNPSGWVYNQVTFNPSTCVPAWLNPSGVWYSGTYTLTVTVTMVVPGQSPLDTGYPPGLSIHLDDIGLALKPLATTMYGSATFPIPTGLSDSQVQGVEVGINATGAPQNTTLYAYVADNSRFVYNPVLWVQVGSASFTNAGTIDSVSALPNAAYYVNTTQLVASGKPEVGFLVVKVNATSSAPPGVPSPPGVPYSVNLVVYAVIQTFNLTRAVVEFTNLGNSPLNLLSLVITGPGTALTSSFPTNFYVAPGEKMVLPEKLVWLPGQVYTVTVTTKSGLTFASSFTAPLS
jgi:hypothetical protein